LWSLSHGDTLHCVPQQVDLFAVANMLAWLPAEPIGSFRRAHDPTAHLIGPHLTVVFPVPKEVGRDAFLEHVRAVVSQTPAFDIRLHGVDRTWDHWLFLTVAEGREETVALHDALYTGVLRPYLLTERPYVPHVGLGQFALERDTHDLLTVRPRELDRSRFEEARREVVALGLDYRGRFDSAHVLGLAEALTHITPIAKIALARG